MFNALNVSKEWNIPQKHRIDACFDCGDPDHGIPKCPKPINQSRINKAKSKFSRSGVGHGYPGGGRNGHDKSGHGHGAGCGCGDGNKVIPHGKWRGDAKTVNLGCAFLQEFPGIPWNPQEPGFKKKDIHSFFAGTSRKSETDCKGTLNNTFLFCRNLFC